MIPVFGVPYINRPDLIAEMLESVDVPVGRYVLIDNSPDAELRISLPNAVTIAARHNFGVAASWNMIIKATPAAPWWALVNSDIVFAPGDLARLSEHMETSTGVGMLATPAAWGISKAAIDKVGWFDENFVPAYYEDNDFVYRCGLLDVPVVPLAAGYSHYRSATIRSDDQLRIENGRTFPRNTDYYHRKWGGGPCLEGFRTPFNEGGDPKGWTLDRRRLEELEWR